ncbi:host specificity factor TipJ family phage tail protein [Alcanivorax sp. S6407]|uniref:host specificity factor TipJ family phage tail protein n=1 Tax=Alcanivorax sp. S6407 TaxID=2926424 RepID=UPI001FF35664|nr:host specificity factor TipJ family phage tail protein [Alcanivorax sp. S6407]MCK0153849.1 host specificity factor TipJ family phage tail protein [Alcanivorax sp. S6407]
MIKVYPSIGPCEPIEEHEVEGITVGQWMADNVAEYKPGNNQPVSITINGDLLPPSRWGCTVVNAPDNVAIRIQPAGVQLLIGAISLRETFRPIINALQPDFPSQTGSGSAFSPVSAQANIARLGQAVPEPIGRYRRYPDYLLPPRRWFTGKKKQQLNMLLCVGPGEYDIPISGVKVGNTPLTALGADAEFTIYEPNADLSAEEAAEWWHNCREVGATAGGNAGIALGSVSNVSDYPDASAFTFSGDTISIPAGAGSFPAGWNNTLVVRVEQYLDYTIESGGTRDIIRGPLDQLGAFAGMLIEIAGDNFGNYTVESFTASVPDATGSASTLTGNAVPARYDFDVTSASFSVLLDGNSQTVTLNTDVTDLSGLITELNSQLDATIQAQDDGSGKVQLVEQGPSYSGAAITVSGDYTDVLGASPVGVTGDETTVAAEAEMTLSYDSGDPVTGLTPDAARMAIGYRGMLYLVDGATTSEIELTRLDDELNADSGWPGFDTVTTTDGVVYVEGNSASVGWAGPFLACPDGEVTDEIELDFMFPKGLVYFSGDGGTGYLNASVRVQWREAGTADSWTDVGFSYFESTLNQIGFTETLNLPSSIQAEVRVRRGTGPSTAKGNRDIEWYGMRAKLNPPTSYPWTTMAVKLVNSSKIASASENQINVEAERKLPVLSGGVWQPAEENSDIAPALYHIAESVGMEIDHDELVRLDGIWKGRGDKFGFVFDETTVRDAMKMVLRAGMSELTLDQGVILPVRDEPRTTFERGQGFSPQNMTGPLTRSFKAQRPDDADGVDVEFTNGSNWTKQTVECRLPGDLGIKVEKIRLDGVTDRTQAWQIGMRARLAMKYRRWEFSFDTELDGLNANYMSYVPILDDLPSYGQSSILLAIEYAGSSGALLTVSEPMDWSDSGASYVVAYRNPDGTVAGPWPATRGDDDYHIIADIPLPWPDLTARQEPPHVYFGTTERWAFKALITSVRPRGMLGASVTATNYDDRVYDYDDQTPPA